MLKDIKIWKGRHTSKGREARIYVHTDDDREGCLYLSGNPWHEKGTIEGDLTDQEWQEARGIAVWDGKWHTVYENQMPHNKPSESQQKPTHRLIDPLPIKKNRHGQHCWMCGRWVEPDEGETFHVDDEDEAMYGFQAGWLVQCLDRENCRKAVEEAKVEREREHAEEEAKKAAWEALPKEEQRRLSEELWEGFFEATQYLT